MIVLIQLSRSLGAFKDIIMHTLFGRPAKIHRILRRKMLHQDSEA